MKYDVNYFIKKFSGIPDEKWATQEFMGNDGAYCALGHCGVTGIGCEIELELAGLPEARALFRMSHRIDTNIMVINDGGDPQYQQPTAKERVLAFLEDKRVEQEGQKVEEPVRQRIVYVAVSETINKMEKVLN